MISDDFSLAFNTPEGVEALTYYADLINVHKVTPPALRLSPGTMLRPPSPLA